MLTNIIYVDPVTYYNISKMDDAIISRYCSKCYMTFYAPYFSFNSSAKDIQLWVDNLGKCNCKEGPNEVEELSLNGFVYKIKEEYLPVNTNEIEYEI